MLQVHKSFPGSPGSVELSQSPPMLLGGTHFVVPVRDFTLGTLTNPSELHDDGTIEDLNI